MTDRPLKKGGGEGMQQGQVLTLFGILTQFEQENKLPNLKHAKRGEGGGGRGYKKAALGKKVVPGREWQLSTFGRGGGGGEKQPGTGKGSKQKY